MAVHQSAQPFVSRLEDGKDAERSKRRHGLGDLASEGSAVFLRGDRIAPPHSILKKSRNRTFAHRYAIDLGAINLVGQHVFGA